MASTFNKENLLKLADYLDSLPADYTHFHMGTYLKMDGWEPELGEIDTDIIPYEACGTVACAIGHGPAAGFPILDKHEDWDAYCLEHFGLDANEAQGCPWDWCFSSFWKSYDNTHTGAVRRIRYLVEHGAPPEDWTYSEYKA